MLTRLKSLCCCALAVAAICHHVDANDFVWKTTSGGSWSDSTRWEPAGVPAGDDTAVVPSLTFGGLVLPSDVFVAKVTLGDLNISGIGSLSADEVSLSDTIFTVDASEELAAPRFLVIGELGRIFGNVLTSWTIINQGGVTNYGMITPLRTQTNQMEVEEVPGWSNESGSQLWLVNAGSGLKFSDITGQPPPLPEQFPWFSNRTDALLAMDSPGITQISWHFANWGEIRVEQGTMELLKTALLDGPMFVGAGATLAIRNSSTLTKITADAVFSGSGTVDIRGTSQNPYNVEATLNIPNPVVINEATFLGETINFLGPVTWRNIRGVNQLKPIYFFMPTTGENVLERDVVNLSIATDDDIRPTNGVTWNNMPLSAYIISDSSSASVSPRGLFTNHFLATIDLSPGGDMLWNIQNHGLIKGSLPGKFMLIKGNLRQSETAELQLRSGLFDVTNQFSSEGMISGYGTLNARTLRVSGKVEPHGSNDAFGRISLIAGDDSGLNTSNAVFKIDIGGATNDNIFAQGGSFSGTFDLNALSGFGPGNYVLARYIVVPNPGPFRLGMVPPGYRYQLTNNTVAREVRVIVSEPVTVGHILPPGDGTNISLNIFTLTNVPYTIQYKEQLTDPWLPWTNFLGNGQPQFILPPLYGTSGFYKIIEGNP